MFHQEIFILHIVFTFYYSILSKVSNNVPFSFFFFPKRQTLTSCPFEMIRFFKCFWVMSITFQHSLVLQQFKNYIIFISKNFIFSNLYPLRVKFPNLIVVWLSGTHNIICCSVSIFIVTVFRTGSGNESILFLPSFFIGSLKEKLFAAALVTLVFSC